MKECCKCGAKESENIDLFDDKANFITFYSHGDQKEIVYCHPCWRYGTIKRPKYVYNPSENIP